MVILLVTNFNCKECMSHLHEVVSISDKKKIKLIVLNCDDSKYLLPSINALQEYKLQQIPSLVLLDNNDKMLAKVEGLDFIEFTKTLTIYEN